jgi:filamentous hemagglutinin
LGLSKIVAGAVSAYSGGDAQTAITTAETAVRNNFLTFDQNQLRKQASAACKTGNAQACADEKRWDAIDVSRDEKVRQVCSTAPKSQECKDWRGMALLARNSYDGKLSSRNSVLDELAFGKYADASELQSIQKLIATTPYAYGSDMTLPPHLKSLAGIVLDLTPLVGDAKAFYEAKDPFDYAVAMIGVLGPVGDGAAAAIKAAKAAHQAGNVTEAVVQLRKAEQITQNAINGRVFEGSGLQAMGLDKNKNRITAVSRTGESITIVPDAILGGLKGTYVEFKNVINITDTSQFRGYVASGQPVILVVSPRTENISETVWNAIIKTGGHIKRYDPATGSQTMLKTRPGA